MEPLKIIAFSVLAACVYGIAHDLVTTHVCIEYFTVAHPPVFPTARRSYPAPRPAETPCRFDRTGSTDRLARPVFQVRVSENFP